ncbi:hypothetical protein PAERUG_E15_London_28_01_14_03989 [Pseudomonas aeruginosa]|nr:hypothetical protein PAERUG_E15_London_28_01_14_03989 [Pseudomonas aeruginosa]
MELVIATIALEAIIALPAIQKVVSMEGFRREPIIPEQIVVSGPTRQRVVPLVAYQEVLARSAVEFIIAGRSRRIHWIVQIVVESISPQLVIAVAATQDVGTTLPIDEVVACTTIDDVGPRDIREVRDVAQHVHQTGIYGG